MTDTIFETARLVVRPWTTSEADVDFLFDLYRRWEVQRYLGSTPKVMESRERAATMAARLSVADATALCGAWAISLRESGDLLGTVLLKELPDVAGLASRCDVEVGWHLHPRAWHHGYATEAAEGALKRGLGEGIPEIIALTYKENLPSQAVCRRLGMTHLGQTDRYYGTDLELFTRSRQ
jgi:RimJ/RimL family protein N-acetyltransferase